MCKTLYVNSLHLCIVMKIHSLLNSKTMKNSKSIDAFLKCVTTCERCITDCIVSNNKECISLCRDCADICNLSARLEARGSRFSKDLYALCAKVCKECSIECAKHASHHDSCKACSEACKKCAAICEELASAKVY